MSPTRQRDDWRSRGACLSADPDLFFPLSLAAASAGQVARAKGYCAHCAVRAECTSFALDHPDVQGIWGGTTDTERQNMSRTGARATSRSMHAA